MKYLFYISKVYSIPIIQPLAKYLKSQNIEYCFYVSAKVLKNAPQEWDKKLLLTLLDSAKKFNPDFVLCPGNFVDFRIPGIKVQLFHGLGVEKEAHYKIRHFFDIYLTSGPFVTKRFESIRKKNPYFLILETGWPKIDYILNYNSENIRKNLDLPSDKKIILYAPTFSTQHESATSLLDIIPRIIQENEFWLFKFHELMDKEVIKEFERIDPEKGRVLQNLEITPYLHASDVMVSDTSSVIYEFMVLDKPIVTFQTQSREDKGINILNPNELQAALDRSKKNPDELRQNRLQNLQEINPKLDGNISKTIFEQLEEIKKDYSFPKKGKPFNLFRKWQIVYHSIFKKGYLR
ncbi:MAG: hypothetical protein D8M58_03955 [Calditrichaeota bacterium]|nr:MAG: hypothetical protein DWQ03_03120 [Calditrichota bacterium]MBL1204522.1 hypothetical protein [Calditrichota bacterium]NOG44350.1 hypothetical protein [Calditrichota bacterium]